MLGARQGKKWKAGLLVDYGCLPRFKHDLPGEKLYGGAGEERVASELGSSKDDFKVVFFFFSPHLDLSGFIGLWAKQLQQVNTYIVTGRVVWKIVKNLIDPKKVCPGVFLLFLSSCLFLNWGGDKKNWIFG